MVLPGSTHGPAGGELGQGFLGRSLGSRSVPTEVSSRNLGVFRMHRRVLDRPLPAVVEGLPPTEAALAYAQRLHKGQHRTVDGAPFILHPLEVASLLYYAGAIARVGTGLRALGFVGRSCCDGKPQPTTSETAARPHRSRELTARSTIAPLADLSQCEPPAPPLNALHSTSSNRFANGHQKEPHRDR